MARFSKRERAFIEQYLGANFLNGTRSAIAAGYSERSAAVIASENLRKPKIAAEIQRRLAEMAMEADEVLLRLGKQARGEVTRYITIDPDTGKPGFDFAACKADGNLHLIKGFRFDRHGNPIIEFYDAQSALVNLGRYHTLFTDKTELSGEVTITGDADVAEQRDRALSTLTDALGALLSGASGSGDGAVDAAEPPAVDGAAQPGG